MQLLELHFVEETRGKETFLNNLIMFFVVLSKIKLVLSHRK